MSRHLLPFRHFVGNRIVKRGGFVHGCSTKGGRGVNVVSTVLRRPRLLVLSRPFGFLSPDSRSMVGRLLGECGRRRKTAIVVSDRGLGRAISIYPHVTLLRGNIVVHSVQGRGGSTRRRLRTCFGINIRRRTIMRRAMMRTTMRRVARGRSGAMRRGGSRT